MKTEVAYIEFEVENFNRNSAAAKKIQQLCNTKDGGGWFPYSQESESYSMHSIYKVFIVRRTKEEDDS